MQFLAVFLVAGIAYPISAAIAGLVYLAGRVVYFAGAFSPADPKVPVCMTDCSMLSSYQDLVCGLSMRAEYVSSLAPHQYPPLTLMCMPSVCDVSCGASLCRVLLWGAGQEAQGRFHVLRLVSHPGRPLLCFQNLHSSSHVLHCHTCTPAACACILAGLPIAHTAVQGLHFAGPANQCISMPEVSAAHAGCSSMGL